MARTTKDVPPLFQPGQRALVTGASTGLGRAFAQQLAARGLDLIIVARSAERLEPVAHEIRRVTGRDVIAVAKDLSVPGAAEELWDEVQAAGLAVDVLVNSAGIGAEGDTVDADPGRLRSLIRLNVEALTDLSARFGRLMRGRGTGLIVNIASVAAVAPTAHMAAYGASKSYVLNFTQALGVELEGSGVRVVAVLPGPTRTNFASNGGVVPGPETMHADPSEVVALVLSQIERRPSASIVIPGTSNKASAALLSALPRRWATALAGRAMTL